MATILLAILFYFFRVSSGQESLFFLIHNADHNKCAEVLSNTSVVAAPCKPSAASQQFRWVSDSRLVSKSTKLCLGVTTKTNMAKVQLFECDAKSDLQKWECKDEHLFAIQGAKLQFNHGNTNDQSIIIYSGSGSWSKWKIHGTKDDLCSRGYEDIFTIIGNSNGLPCQFPFKFQNHWFVECTIEGRADGRLWCATTQSYDEDGKWGMCPEKGAVGWDVDPVTGVFYQRNTMAALTWHEARKSCQQQDSDLLSIVELHEQTYLTGLTNSLSTPLWMGLNSLDFESGWQWSDGSPFRYLNWAPGSPSHVPGLNCAVINPGKGGKWESDQCSKKLGYICRKGNATSTSALTPVTDQPGFCQNHWVPYAGHCYYIERSKKIWKEASTACHKEGAFLASIHNIEEHSFVISQLGYGPSDELWIGLNDLKMQMLFEWTDGSHVTFTKWQTGEPSHASGFQEDCVLIKGKDGKWLDHSCEKSHGYICKKKAMSKPHGVSEVVQEGCKPGWTRNTYFCYYVGSKMMTFSEANQTCAGMNSILASVDDRYEHAYLISLVGLRPEKYFWIGLSNTENRDTFKWTSGQQVRFTHFNVNMPGRRQGCVGMTTGTLAGLWDVNPCTTMSKFICKQIAEGVTTPPPLITTPAPKCPDGWNSYSESLYCYKLFKKEIRNRKTWHEARDYCISRGGNLLSVHSQEEQNKIYSSIGYYYNEAAWIGLNNLDPGAGYVWSNGRPTNFENWAYGEPNNFNGAENCAEMSLSTLMLWNDRHCESYNNWFCELRKGDPLLPVPTASQPAWNVTEDGWLVYNGSHYFVNNEKLSMEQAREFCQKNFGDLAIIESESERKFLWKQISRGEENEYYIGLTVGLDKTMKWIDGSPLTYVAWEMHEPNFANNDENCVTMYKGMGFWNDMNCGTLFPSICERKDTFVNTTMAPTLPPKGGCQPGWISFGRKCFRLYGVNDGEEKKNWQEARNQCISDNGNLATISDNKEQAFLAVQLVGLTINLWIGLNDINREMRYLWTEGKGVFYTNWAKGYPISGPEGRYFYSDEEYDCVVIASGNGYWKNDDCYSRRAFICQKYKDVNLPNPPTTSAPKGFIKFGSSSYKIITQKMKWDEARRQCKAEDADLASILDPLVTNFLLLYADKYKEPLWIGLNSNMTGGFFKWIDNWRMHFSNWAPDEPNNNLACVYMDVTGGWKTATCNNTYFSVCKQTKEIAPTEPAQLPGKCPDPKKKKVWVPFRGHCYLFQSSSIENWAHASVECLRSGGNLLSVEDPMEATFVEKSIEILHDKAKSFWIGMYKNIDGSWLWIDNSVVDYVNWDSGEPSRHKEECVEIFSGSGKWNNMNCNSYRGYICKTAKTIEQTVKPQKPEAQKPGEKPSHSYSGIVVGVLILILTAAGLAAFLVYKRRRLPVINETNFDNTLYFNSETSLGTQDTKVLVANIEQNEHATF
ncbi:MRC1 protein, partial [Polypterus senegalus]